MNKPLKLLAGVAVLSFASLGLWYAWLTPVKKADTKRPIEVGSKAPTVGTVAANDESRRVPAVGVPSPGCVDVSPAGGAPVAAGVAGYVSVAAPGAAAALNRLGIYLGVQAAVAAMRRSWSTATTAAAPCCRASQPITPLPQQRSSQRAPARRRASMFITASRTREGVGRAVSPGGLCNLRPPLIRRLMAAAARASGATGAASPPPPPLISPGGTGRPPGCPATRRP